MEQEHNHTEEIARAMYVEYSLVAAMDAPQEQKPTRWEELSRIERNAWIRVASEALTIICDHAANDVKDYLKSEASTKSGWKKWLYIAGASIAAALAGAGILSAPGCGVMDFSIKGTDGSGLILKQDPETGKIIIVGTRPEINVEEGK